MEQIILYTSDTCDRCKIVKHMLNTHSVNYIEVTDRDYILGLGIEGVPAIEVGDKIISEYPSVLSWLENNGYYSFEVNDND
jgi:glutaredoxin